MTMQLRDFIISGKFNKAPIKTERDHNHFEVLVSLGADATMSCITDEVGIEWLKEHNFIK